MDHRGDIHGESWFFPHHDPQSAFFQVGLTVNGADYPCLHELSSDCGVNLPAEVSVLGIEENHHALRQRNRLIIERQHRSASPLNGLHYLQRQRISLTITARCKHPKLDGRELAYGLA